MGAKKKAAEEVVLDGVKLSKVYLPFLTASAVALGLWKEEDTATAETLVPIVAKHYAAIDVDLQGECGVCDGIASTELERCPYCTANEDDEQLPEAIAAPVAQVLVPKPKKAALAVVPKADDLAVSTSLITERELDEKVKNILRLKAAGAENYWQLGRAIKEIFDSKEWNLRTKTDEEGKTAPKYKSWDAFVHHELDMTPTHAYATMDVASKFSVDQIKAVGTTKLGIVLRAPDEDQPGLLNEAGDTTTRELRDKVQKIKKEKGHVRPSRGKQGGTSKTQVNKPKGDKITIAQLEGRQTVKLFKKPATRTYEIKDLDRAKKFADVPFGTMELVNGVRMNFTIVGNANGEWQMIVETKRETAE